MKEFQIGGVIRTEVESKESDLESGSVLSLYFFPVTILTAAFCLVIRG
jgi:hypothetical protein